MSEQEPKVTVSMRMSPKQAGALWMSAERMKVRIRELKEQLAAAEKSGRAAAAAIAYALEDDEPELFLRNWNEGEFEVLRKEWDDVPDEVFDGVDPLFKK